jgi:hypothetical protein
MSADFHGAESVSATRRAAIEAARARVLDAAKAWGLHIHGRELVQAHNALLAAIADLNALEAK